MRRSLGYEHDVLQLPIAVQIDFRDLSVFVLLAQQRFDLLVG